MNSPLPFEEDNQGMYGDWDLPEDNERARAVMGMIEDRPSFALDFVAACAIAFIAASLLYAIDAQPGKMLSMFSTPSVTADIPTVYAPTGEWKRRP